MRALGPRTSRSWLIVLLAVGIAPLPSCDRPSTTDQETESPTASGEDVSESPTLSFRFDVKDRQVVSTAGARVRKRERRIAHEAADRVQSLVTDLYVGAFLDPENWRAGTYNDVFEIFATGGRAEAQRRSGVLTAGENAGERFDRIEPVDGRLTLRILLDRGGKPILVAATVRFQARGSGTEPRLISSDGSYLFRRMKGSWRIVSFDVERADREGGTA